MSLVILTNFDNIIFSNFVVISSNTFTIYKDTIIFLDKISIFMTLFAK